MANPYLTLGGIAAAGIAALFGFVLVPGWVADAQDAQAIGDLGRIKTAQSAAYDVNGTYYNTLAGLDTDGKWGLKVTLSKGVKLADLDAASTGWCGTVKSESGRFFGTSSKASRIVRGDTSGEVMGIVCAGAVALPAPSIPGVSASQSGTTVTGSISTAAVCARGTVRYRIQYRSSTTANGSWGDYTSWSTALKRDVTGAAQGTRYGFRAEAMCARGAQESGATPSMEASLVTPIAAPSPTITLDLDGTDLTATAAASCAPGTSARYGFRYRSTTTETAGSWSGWSALATDKTFTVSPPEWGARYGFEVRARCITAHGQSSVGTSAERTIIVPLAPPARPTVTATETGGVYTTTVSNTCAPGTTPEWSQRRDIRTTSTALAYGPWAGGQTATGPLGEGARLDVQGRIRCSTEFNTTAWSAAASANVIRDITTRPAITGLGRTLTNDKGTATATIAACPAGTTKRYEFHERTGSGSWTSRGWTDSTNPSVSRAGSLAVGQGVSWQGGFRAECYTAYRNGGNDGWKDTTAIVRAIAAPTPSLSLAMSGTNLRATMTGVTCAAGTTREVQYRTRNSRSTALGTWTGWSSVRTALTFDVANPNAGAKYGAEGRARCITPLANSPWGTTNAPTRVIALTAPKAPTAKATITGGTRYTTVSNSCVSGVSVRYQQRLLVRNANSAVNWGAWQASYRVEGGINQGYRVDMQGRVQCYTAHTQTGWSPTGAATATRPITTTPKLANAKSVISGSRGQGSVDLSGCPAGTTYRMQTHETLNGEGWTDYAWANSAAGRRYFDSKKTVNQGARWRMAFHARCITHWTNGPVTNVKHSSYAIRPITAVPSAYAIGTRNGGDIYANIGGSRSCPAGTTFRWRFNDRQGYGSWGAWSHSTSNTGSWYSGAGSKYARTVAYDSSGEVQVHYLCRSNYDNGTGKYSTDRTSVRPIPAPYSFSVSGSVNRICDNMGFNGRVKWTAASYANSYTLSLSWATTSGGRASKNVGSVSGFDRGISHVGPSAMSVRAQATMVARNGSGTRTVTQGLSQVMGCSRIN
ncbi:hypothetical protein [Microbacterium sp. 77mftsu3.1]|uniref:hypothetical protein n=1 Tax=Microbacterium sp. 77mftsu3.1 TaxID=1761802 RepID=UPI000370C8DD|nr:hypothetical protein [Microbacterium sp. 77mftsu3.1]SDH32776.1 hypothetical protein SAMN04488590_3037 [Microbacterium sp. 77mftsu3.1]